MMRVTGASGGSLLFAQYQPFAILKPKKRKNEPSGGLGSCPLKIECHLVFSSPAGPIPRQKGPERHPCWLP